jgi:hypothetical protein
MATPEVWLEVLAGTKALFEATKASVDVFAVYRKYREDRDTVREAQRVSVAFSSYSEAEVRALANRLEGCRSRFIAQGGGAERANCVCSVLQKVIEGNGGILPLIDDWRNIYDQLHCGRARKRPFGTT